MRLPGLQSQGWRKRLRPLHRANARSPSPAASRHGRIPAAPLRILPRGTRGRGTMRSMVVGGVGRMRAPARTIATARRLRRNLSLPEALLWARLKRRETGEAVFRRQHPAGPYVLDFYCAKARLAFEIDGSAHDAEGAPERDARRDAWLNAQGIVVVRILAGDVLRSVDEAANAIARLAKSRIAEAAAPPPPR